MTVKPTDFRCKFGHSLVSDESKRFDRRGQHHCRACELEVTIAAARYELRKLGVNA